MSEPIEPIEPEPPKSILKHITTHWSVVRDPGQFVVRYSRAIDRYLLAILGNPQDAEEVSQEFLLNVSRHGFARLTPDGGRFRDYLIKAVRNTALTFLNRRKNEAIRTAEYAQFLKAQKSESEIDRLWLDEWRACILDRAWDALHRHERRSSGNLFYTVLRVTIEHEDDDSEQQARLVSERIGRTVSSEALRKQRSRARQMFAGLILESVGETLDQATEPEVFEELAAIGLLSLVQPYFQPK